MSAAAQPTLFAAPHRPMFLAGGVTLLTGFMLWALEMAARAELLPALGWLLPAGWMHALIVLAGVFPFFMFGFLLTAMPRWQGMADLTAAHWLWPWRLLAGGWAVAFVGMWVPGVLALGLASVLAGWAMVARVLWTVAHQPRPERMHARITCWGVIAGCVGVAFWLLAALTGEAVWARIAINMGVWWFVLPVFFAVCHRMVPFFSSNIIPNYVMVRPRWVAAVVVGASLAHGLLAMFGAAHLAWIVDLPAAVATMWLSWRWRLLPSLKVPLLGMLHMGFAWLGVAWLLFAIQGLVATFGSFVLGMAPLHALGIGFFGSILLGMVSRVTLGHSGRPLQADALTWGLFLGLQLVVVLRILADLVPWALSAYVMLLAAIGWLGIFVAWGLRYLPIYWRPRVDGKTG
ncbi:MAG TPA: NnrS family protein [Rhodocyclaceae bacterium]|nr:NnrS family protein [Rhodocyclaceae bacterium]